MYGELESRKGNLEVKSMILSPNALNKISKTFEMGILSRENQDFFIESIIIDSKDQKLFEEGQSPLVKIENGWALTSDSRRNPLIFKGKFNGFVTVDDMLAVCEIVLGAMEFNLENIDKEFFENDIEYKNVPVIIYSTGNYMVNLLED